MKPFNYEKFFKSTTQTSCEDIDLSTNAEWRVGPTDAFLIEKVSQNHTWVIVLYFFYISFKYRQVVRRKINVEFSRPMADDVKILHV